MLNAKYSKILKKIYLSDSASKTYFVTPQLLISFKFLYDQLITFWAIPIPRENTPDWVTMSESVLEKGPTLGSKIGPFVWSLVYPKCSKVKSLMTLKSFIDRKTWWFTNYSWGLVHALGLFSWVHLWNGETWATCWEGENTHPTWFEINGGWCCFAQVPGCALSNPEHKHEQNHTRSPVASLHKD